MLVDLLGAGLADVDDRQPVEVPGLDLALPPRRSADRVIAPRIARASRCPGPDFMGFHAAPPASLEASAAAGPPSG